MTKLHIGAVIIFLLCFSAISSAEENLPSDPRLLFNHGAELAASGDFDKAADILRQVAVARDKTIAAKALSLLGQITVVQAKEGVAENPVETLPEQRQSVLDHLQSAEQSFTESLSLLPNKDVRQHLETLRAWRHNMTQLWNEYDRKQKRSTELQQRIQWLADWEKKLTEQVRPITEEADSPRKYQTAYESSQEQKKIAEELTLLQDVPIDDETIKEQWSHLPAIQKIADETAELLAQNQTKEALPKQQQVWDFLQSLLKQEQNQQNQDQQNKEQQEQNKDNENQESKNQEDQKQEKQEQEKEQQNQQQSEEQKENGEQQQGENQPQSSPQEQAAQKKEENAKEKAERLLLQVRRKEQSAEKRREQLRALQMQAEPVEKDW